MPQTTFVSHSTQNNWLYLICLRRSASTYKVGSKDLKIYLFGYSRVLWTFLLLFLTFFLFEYESREYQESKDDFFIYNVISPSNPLCGSSSRVFTSICQPITEVYDRRQPSSIPCPTPKASSSLDPEMSDDLPIALRKGKLKCAHLISSSVSYNH